MPYANEFKKKKGQQAVGYFDRVEMQKVCCIKIKPGNVSATNDLEKQQCQMVVGSFFALESPLQQLPSLIYFLASVRAN